MYNSKEKSLLDNQIGGKNQQNLWIHASAFGLTYKDESSILGLSKSEFLSAQHTLYTRSLKGEFLLKRA
jgi:hypothetical protein